MAEATRHALPVPPCAGLAQTHWPCSRENSLYDAGIFTQAIHMFYRLQIHPTEMSPPLKKCALAWHFARAMVRYQYMS